MAATSAPVAGIEVWVESHDDLDALAERLGAALADTTAHVAAVDAPSGSLWPVPVDATTNRVRVRLVVDGDESAVVDALEHVATVSPWSLVHRIDGSPAKGPPVLH